MEVKSLNVFNNEWVDVHEDGRIFTIDRYTTQRNQYSEYTKFIKGKQLVPSSNGKAGYFQVSVSGRKFYTHVLSFLAFHGEIPEGYEIDHIDEDKTNWKPNNLRLLTHRDNILRNYVGWEYKSAESKQFRCACGKVKARYSTVCKNCRSKSFIDLDIEWLETLVKSSSWVNAAKVLNISDNGLKKAYRRVSGKDPKLLKS